MALSGGEGVARGLGGVSGAARRWSTATSHHSQDHGMYCTLHRINPFYTRGLEIVVLHVMVPQP